MTRLGSAILSTTPEGTGFDWIVHYRPYDGDMAILPIFDRETMAEVLDEAHGWLDGPSGEDLGTYEIICIVRRDMVQNADEILGTGRRPN